MSLSLLLVGCGKMGSAMLDGWIDRGIAPDDIIVIEPMEGAADALRQRLGVCVHASQNDIPANWHPDILILAVKPQILDKVMPGLERFSGGTTVFLSIAAGKTISYFEGYLGNKTPIVRSMPNTPAAVRRGITVANANDRVNQDQKNLCHQLLEAVGDVHWVDDEGLLDAVTAVSGGGPAYVFLLVECLTKAGIAAGLPAELADQLARVTVSGSGELLARSTEPPETLRQNVTSPGGTTAEALAVLMADDGLQSLLTRAIAAATEQSRKLAG